LATNESIDVKITANAADLTVDAKTKRNGTITVSAPSSKQPIKTVSVGLIVQGKPNTPVIDHLSPETGLPGTKVTVYGEGFGDQMFSELRFGGVTIEAQTWTDTQIEFIVPKSGFPAGSGYDVTVTKKQLVGTEVLASDASEPKIFKVVALSGTTKVFPNPFDPNSEVAKIEVVVSTNTNVSISIYDITGLLVWKKDAAVSSGTETIEWTGRDMYGRLSGDGVYLVRVMDNDSKVLLSKGKILVVKR
jgi:hypothetical protein